MSTGTVVILPFPFVPVALSIYVAINYPFYILSYTIFPLILYSSSLILLYASFFHFAYLSTFYNMFSIYAIFSSSSFIDSSSNYSYSLLISCSLTYSSILHSLISASILSSVPAVNKGLTFLYCSLMMSSLALSVVI